MSDRAHVAVNLSLAALLILAWLWMVWQTGDARCLFLQCDIPARIDERAQ